LTERTKDPTIASHVEGYSIWIRFGTMAADERSWTRAELRELRPSFWEGTGRTCAVEVVILQESLHPLFSSLQCIVMTIVVKEFIPWTKSLQSNYSCFPIWKIESEK